MRYSIRAVLALAFATGAVKGAGACGSDANDDHEFDMLQECVAAHVDFGEAQAIAHCLLEQFDMNFADQSACVAYVTANGGYPNSRDQACMLYFEQHQ